MPHYKYEKRKLLKGICWPFPSQGHLQSYRILATYSLTIVPKSTIDDDNTMLEQICWVQTLNPKHNNLKP